MQKYNLIQTIRWILSQSYFRKLKLAIYHARHKYFDLRMGITTAGTHEITDVDSKENRNSQFGVAYSGTEPGAFRDGIFRTGIDPRTFHFVDLGSGKAKALILAAESGFEKLSGVEFSPKFHSAANGNIKTYLDKRRNKKTPPKIQNHLMDATHFRFPEDPIFLYLFNPFRAPVLEKVLLNLKEEFGTRPRPLHVLYMNPECSEEFQKANWLTQMAKTDWYNWYQYHPKQASTP